MNRSELVAKLAERFDLLTRQDAEAAVETILEAMTEALTQERRIEIRGFGSFVLTLRPSRIGRNPRSGEPVQIPERRIPHFKPGKALRQGVERAAESRSPQAGTATVQSDSTSRASDGLGQAANHGRLD